MNEIWAYCRVSTTKEEQEESLDAQAAWAEAFARERGAAIRIVKEQASAKTTVGRPKFNAMMAELAALPKARRPELLLVTALDRLSRSTRDTLNVIEALREFKVTLYQRGLGPVTAEDFPRLASLIGMSLAGEAENYGRSIRMKQSWEKRRSEGKPTSNKVPYGLQLRGGRDVVIPESAAWVLKAFEWYGSGEMGMYRIAHRFADGAPDHTWLTSKIGEDGERIPKTRKATKWEANRIRKLLELKRYRGTAVPEDLFDRVQERLAKTPRSGSRRIREYPISGAMKCEGCERRLHGVASGGSTTRTLADGTKKRYPAIRRIRYYECYICRYKLNAERLEAEFFAKVGDLEADDAILRRWVDAPRIGSRERASLEKELKQLETQSSEGEEKARRDRAFDLALDARLDEAELRRQLQRISDDFASKRERVRALRENLESSANSERTVTKARELLRSFHRLYAKAAYEQKRELAAAVAEALGGVTVSAEGLRWLKEPAVPKPSKRVKPVAVHLRRTSKRRRA